MAGRRKLKGLAGGLAHYCLSRNFDAGGYWAMGKLYAAAYSLGIQDISLELMKQEFRPEFDAGDLNESVDRLVQLIDNYLEANGISSECITSAEISFSFETVAEKTIYGQGRSPGKPFRCRVAIQSDLGTSYTYELGSNVWLHDCKRESRRNV